MERTPRLRRRAMATVLALTASVALSGCGFDVQTLQTYTPAHGVNVDTEGYKVKVRNLLIIADTAGKGVLSASLTGSEAAKLTAVEGQALKADGSDASPLEFTFSPVPIEPRQLTVLTDGASPITVTNPDLKPGLLANLRLTFDNGQSVELKAPVMSAESSIYQDAFKG